VRRLAAITLALVAAGCGSRERTIPFRADLRPGPVPIARNVPPIPHGAPRCRPAAARFVTAGGQGVDSDTMAYYVAIENRGTRTCVVHNDPIGVTVPARPPGPVSVVTGTEAFDPGYPKSNPSFGLRPGASANATVLVDQVCRTEGKPQPPLRLHLFVAFFPPVKLAPLGCASGTFVSVTRFAPPPHREPRRARWPLRAALELPASVRRGGTLAFRVRLTNNGRRPFRFPWCPVLAFTPGKNVFTLNCHPMGTLDPGESALFAMRTRVPRSAPRRLTIEWQLMQPDVIHELAARGGVDVD
jgi:hypothetical protein